MSKEIFYSLAPALKREGGHDLSYHRAVEQAAKLIGLSFQALVAEDCKALLPNSCWQPYFSNFFQDIKKLLKNQKKPAIYFLESFSGKELFSLTINCLLFAKKETRICLLFRYGLHQLYKNGRLHLFFAKLLQKRLGKNFIALTDSEIIRAEMANKIAISLMPIPHTEQTGESPVSPQPIFWWPGSPRPQKGLDDIRHLAKEAAHFPLEMVAARSSGLPITLIDDDLSRENYNLQMSRSSVILLPYDPAVYSHGTSGILVEAVTAGKMPVVKAGSWLAAELRRHNLSELIVDFANPQFFEKTLALLHNKAVQTKLRAMQQAYIAFHGVESFAEHLSRALRNCGSN